MSESRWVRPAGQKCYHCSSEHQTWAAIARCYYQRADSVEGDGDWVAADMHCLDHRIVDLQLCLTEQAAREWIKDQGDCSGTHRLSKVVQIGEFLGLGPVKGGWR
jgi:hypothetical protein